MADTLSYSSVVLQYTFCIKIWTFVQWGINTLLNIKLMWFLMCWSSTFSKKAHFMTVISNEDWVNGIISGWQSITDDLSILSTGILFIIINIFKISFFFPGSQLGPLITGSWQESPLQPGHTHRTSDSPGNKRFFFQ